MKMIATPTAVTADQYTAYVHNCLRNPACEPAYSAPLPGLPYLQLYVDFGLNKPMMTEFQLIDTCGGAGEQIFPSNYVTAQTPEGKWYGVFKYFNSPITPVTGFVVFLSAMVMTPTGLIERTFFSESLMIEPCLPLTKIKSCYPEGATNTGFDVNGIYYGLPFYNTWSGMEGVRFFHIAYVRMGKVRELSNKGTFKSSLYRNFRTTIEKIHQVETELVPKWYKDELLAIYARGAISVNDGAPFIVNELNIEPINDDDITWKPFVQVKETFRLYFGCDESDCPECCSPIVLEAFTTPGESGSDVDECKFDDCHLFLCDMIFDELFYDLFVNYEQNCGLAPDGFEIAVVEAGQDDVEPTFPFIVAPTVFTPPESVVIFEDLQCGPFDVWVRLLCPLGETPWKIVETVIGGDCEGFEHFKSFNYTNGANSLESAGCSFASFELDRSGPATADATAHGHTVKVKVRFTSNNPGCDPVIVLFTFTPTATTATMPVFICLDDCTSVTTEILAIILQ